MISQTYVSRRNQSTAFVRSNNTTMRRTRRNLGSISQIAIVGMLTLIFGLIYVSEGTKATSFDYQLSNLETEISEMTALRDDLAVEKARLTSIAETKNSTVATSMEDAIVTGYATN
ncbi:MAG: hypothetical protein Q4A79_02490 [Candidatus Saccharibacteria bacterium]|nr:hypothetical protein [Candidatus Saccharibacteria bacterium]